jgi:hypothetical protein
MNVQDPSSSTHAHHVEVSVTLFLKNVIALTIAYFLNKFSPK